MIACFGLYDGYHESCFPADRLVENRLRLDAFKLNRIGAFAEGAVTRLKWGDHGGCLLARQAPNILINGNPVRWFETSRDGLGLNARRAAGGSSSPSDDHLHSYSRDGSDIYSC